MTEESTHPHSVGVGSLPALANKEKSMKRYVAERTSEAILNGDIWRDEDVAMATEKHVFDGFTPYVAETKARTMLVGMIMTEAWDWFKMRQDRAELNLYIEGAEKIALIEADEYLHTTGVIYRLRQV